MEIVRAARAGFCLGVSLALDKLEMALATHKATCRVCTLGPIIHNPQVLAHFHASGVCCLHDSEAARPGDFVLIRAHGVPKGEEAALRRQCAIVEDATCPKVKKAQLAIAKATAAGAGLLLFGEAEHPEVRGLVSYCQNGAIVFGSEPELDLLKFDVRRKYVLAAQTTQDKDSFERLARRLAVQIPELNILATICNATRERQEEAMRIAAAVDAMVVVGGRQSGNTRRLVVIAADAGVRVMHVETAAELDRASFRDCARVGLTAGASTPGDIIDAVENWLRAI